jgi:DNA helicase II / ATP-dependent DNA helicase PcrA
MNIFAVEDKSTLDFLSNLNDKQQEAVTYNDGPLLVLAGAGTGKTKVLTSRIARLIQENRAYPSQILAVTFTNKASKEMLARVNDMVMADGIWLGTFHSIAAKILRRHAELIGLSNSYNIIDEDDQLRIIKSIMQSLNIDDKKNPPKIIASIIQSWKDKNLDYNAVDGLAVNQYEKFAAMIYVHYQQKLQNMNAVDFGDLLLYNMQLFIKFPEVLQHYQNRFRYILVDEYQDTNYIQYIWLRLLAQERRNICCVGDDDQSIYGWRGAQVSNILDFTKHFPDAKIVRLEQNYRSTESILGAASHVIANNSDRLGKTLWTEDKGGSKVKLATLMDDRDEARFIAGTIKNYYHNSDYQSIAILVRASHQTRSIEESFIQSSIPYQIIGGMKFYERMEIRDIISYMRTAINLNDDIAFERIINTPRRGIGPATLSQIKQHAFDKQMSMFQSIKDLISKEILKGRVKLNLQELINNFNKWHELLSIKQPNLWVEDILEDSGYLEMWRQEKTIEAEGRVENLKELINAIAEFPSITAFLEHISLVSERDNNQHQKVSIMTLHSAKGLEFDLVFLTGWEEGLFPHQRSLDESGIKGLEEERRLAYVGITRARKLLYISNALSRRVYNEFQRSLPSRFIEEIPQEFAEKITRTFDHSMFASNLTTANNTKYINKDDDENKITIKSSTDNSDFKKGSRVRHLKFGVGRVIYIIDNTSLDIDFFNYGRKRILKDYIQKT